MIQETLFNEVINKFYKILETEKSCVIRNGGVEPAKKVYENVSDNIEITFTQRSEVKEVINDIPYKRTKHFVNFNDTQNFTKGQLMCKSVISLLIRLL